MKKHALYKNNEEIFVSDSLGVCMTYVDPIPQHWYLDQNFNYHISVGSDVYTIVIFYDHVFLLYFNDDPVIAVCRTLDSAKENAYVLFPDLVKKDSSWRYKGGTWYFTNNIDEVRICREFIL